MFSNRRSQQNYSHLYFQAIFAIAAAVALTTACAKNEGGGTPVEAAKPAPAAAVPANTNTNDIGRVASPSKVPSRQRQQLPEEQPEEQVMANGSRQRQSEDPIPSEDADGFIAGESVVYRDHNGQTADQIREQKADVNAEGPYLGERMLSDVRGRDQTPLFYTGASQDTLRDQIYTLVNARAASLDEETRKRDIEFSKSIQLADFSVDWETRRAVLTFKADLADRRGVVGNDYVIMRGPLNPNGIFSVGTLKNGPKLLAEVACMDATRGCQTIHARVQDTSTGKGRTAHIIARHTSLKMGFDGNPIGTAKNAEYDRLMQILLNTASNPRGWNAVNKLTLTTSETIGGASNFRVRMDIPLRNQVGIGGDSIELTGPLVKPRQGTATNVALNFSPILTIVNGEVVPTEALGTEGRIVDTIREARMTSNDGIGNLQLELTIRSATMTAQEDRIYLSLSRIPVQTSKIRLSIR